MSGVEQTYKSRDVEEVIDIWFYRPIGFRIALGARKLGLTPNVLTVIGILIGVTAGHFFFYDSLHLNAIGMGMWVISNMFDSADGQLARMTGQSTQLGRILDGMGGNFVFFSMYVHLCFRYALGDGMIGWWIFLLALAAGASHATQSAMADYYRNAFLRYVARKGKGELERSEAVRVEYNKLSWIKNFLTKSFYRIYLNYTVQQEALSPNFQTLRDRVEATYATEIPDKFASRYRILNKPLLKYYNYLTINGRVLTLFAFVVLGYPELFFVTEITLMNLLIWIVLRRQEKNNKEMTEFIEGRMSIPKREVVEVIV